MIGQTSILEKEFVADGALTQYRVGKKGTLEDDIAPAGAPADSLMGVIQHDAIDNARVRMMLIGIAKVEYGGTITQGDKLTVDSVGRVIKATAHTHVENIAGAYTQNAVTGVAVEVNIVGVAMADGVLGDIGTVFIAPQLA